MNNEIAFGLKLESCVAVHMEHILKNNMAREITTWIIKNSFSVPADFGSIRYLTNRLLI